MAAKLNVPRSALSAKLFMLTFFCVSVRPHRHYRDNIEGPKTSPREDSELRIESLLVLLRARDCAGDSLNTHRPN